MRITRNLKVPTGNILVVAGELGNLEVLSLADYGKDYNLNQDKPVLDGTPMLPLEDKWVVTLSTQYGCSMGCTFCDVPKVGPGVNATYNDLYYQVDAALSLHPEVTKTSRLNVHFARMGEPTWNKEVLKFAEGLRGEVFCRVGNSLVHPVISTMMPRHNKNLVSFLHQWMNIKNNMYDGDAGLQLSINSTSDYERNIMFSNNALSFPEISTIGKWLDVPKGRKITLNFAVADYEIDAVKLKSLFSPDKFICKLTPMHKTTVALENGISTIGDYTTPYPYLHHAEALRKVGFEVLTFIGSTEEDLGRITCGNAILSGTLPNSFTEVCTKRFNEQGCH
jgi:23S rRNA (adenine2503-C2)-methyltransferase